VFRNSYADAGCVTCAGSFEKRFKFQSSLVEIRSGYLLGGQRIINTQDVFHAALLPAAMVLVLWLLIAWWQG
jgi:hypothetical protein